MQSIALMLTTKNRKQNDTCTWNTRKQRQT